MDDIYKLLPNRCVYIIKPSRAVKIKRFWIIWTAVSSIGSWIIRAVVFTGVYNCITVNFITAASVHAGRCGAASSESKKK